MSEPCPSHLRNEIDALDKLVQRCKTSLGELAERRDPHNLRDQVSLISVARILKYADAFVLLVRNGYGEPAACLLRSVFEGYLWIRWSLQSPENAQVYFDAGKGEGVRIVERLVGSGIARLKDQSSGAFADPELVRTMLKDDLKTISPPPWKSMAKDAGLEDLFLITYSLLSGMAHGSLLFLGERAGRASVSPNPDWDNIEPFLLLAHNLVLDSVKVTEHWILQREIQAPPAWTSRDSLVRQPA